MTEQSEFLSPHQCFIVYEDSTKKVAISLRNRLSEKDIKCTIWNEKQFIDNEARMSNFNRLLILNNKIASEYLAAPSILDQEATEYAIYRREGRVASLLLKDNIDFKGVLDTAGEITKKITDNLKSIFKKKGATKNEVVVALDALQREEETVATKNVSNIAKGAGVAAGAAAEAAIASTFGVTSAVAETAAAASALAGAVGAAAGTAAFGLVPSLISLYGYSWYKSNQNEKELRLAFMFAAAREFEVKYFDDFVNAK